MSDDKKKMKKAGWLSKLKKAMSYSPAGKNINKGVKRVLKRKEDK